MLKISTKDHERGVEQGGLDGRLRVLVPPLSDFEGEIGLLGDGEVRLKELDCRLKVVLFVDVVFHF